MAISNWVKKVSKLSLMVGVTSAAAFGVSAPTHAYSIFFGEDLNSRPDLPLHSVPNAQAAEANFLSQLTGTNVETFENFATRTYSPLTLTTSGGQTSTLNGNGSITSTAFGSTNGLGRYSINGTRYWEAEARLGRFWITFNQPIAAFGFYGIDIGDFGGQLILCLLTGDTTTRQLTIPNTIGSFGSTDGSVIYFGIIAENPDEYFTSVSFDMSTGQGDFFAFDNMAFGSIQQVIPTKDIPEPPSRLSDVNLLQVSVPEPSSGLGVMALGAMAAGSLLLRHQRR